MLTRLIYASHALRNLESQDIEQILEAARSRNLIQGVTGMLCYGNGRFLQYLEGEDKAVQSIYARILEDRRHGEIVLIEKHSLERRIFGDWSMGFLDVNNFLIQVILREIVKTDKFLPETFDASTALRLITHLKSSLDDQVIL